MRTEGLADFLFGAYRRRVLGLLYAHPAENFHVREISRISEVPAGSLHRELKLLADHGLVRAARLGNQLRYRANTEAVFSKELTSFLEKLTSFEERSEPSKTARQRLAGLCAAYRIARLGVFGPVARGEASPETPVDVLIEFERGATPAAADRLRAELSELLGREAAIAPADLLEDPRRRAAILRELKTLFPS